MKTRKVNIKDVTSTGRMDGSFHNAEANVYDNIIRAHSQYELDSYCSSIFTSARGQRCYTNKDFGVPFLSNSDVVALDPFMSCKYISKKHSYDSKSLLKGGMILTGRVGAIGQTSFVPKYWEKSQAMGSDNIIRIVVKPEHKNGFIYAYLASKIGNLSFWKHATGGVQPFITDKMVGTLPIPNFPLSFQTEVDDLIQESARLREEATDALEEAKKKLLEFINIDFKETSGFKTAKRKIKDVLSSLQCRLDPPALMNNSIEVFENNKHRTKTIGEFELKVWYPGMFKRTYVKNGLPYMQGSSVFETNPFTRCVLLSRTKTPKLNELWLKDGMILITCAGSCGQIKLITKEYEDKEAIGSPDIIRIFSDDKLITNEFLFVYLQLPLVQDYMQGFKYGSVIERFDATRVQSVPVILPTEAVSAEITSIIKRYKDYTYEAFCKEERAIQMVEQEISKWNN